MELNKTAPRNLNLGAHYGFSVNPYDPAPLGVSSEDAELLVGRDKEGRELAAFLSSFDRGAIVVEGGIGVGKTSFVNVNEYRLSQDEAFLPSLSVIELQNGMTPTEFLLSVLSNSLNALRTLHQEVKDDREFRRLSTAVEQTLFSTRTYQAGITVPGGAGVGGSAGRNLTATNPNVTLLPAVSQYLDDFLTLAQGHDHDKVVVSVNNLDIIDPGFLIQVLHQIRDVTFNRVGYLWIFTGPVGTRAVIAQRAARVSEVMVTDPIRILPLSQREVHQAVDARVRKFRLDANVKAPVDKDVIDILYAASNGEIRYVLNRCKDLLLRTMIDYPTSKHITIQTALALLRNMTTDAIDRVNLTPKQRQVLAKIATKGTAQPKDYARFGFRSSPAFMPYLKLMYGLQLLDRREKGREVFYTPRGDVSLAFNPPSLTT